VTIGDDDLDHAPGASGTGLSGPMSTGPDAGAGPGGPEPAAGEPEHDPSLAMDPEDEVGDLGSAGTFLTDPTEGATSDDVWPDGAEAAAEVDEDDLAGS
jgi:hypothetical protein